MEALKEIRRHTFWWEPLLIMFVVEKLNSFVFGVVY
jgi:hypothetical protein